MHYSADECVNIHLTIILNSNDCNLQKKEFASLKYQSLEVHHYGTDCGIISLLSSETS